MDWSNIQVGKWWPILLGVAAVIVLFLIWYRRRGTLFPDLQLVSVTAPAGGILDRLPIIMGTIVMILLILSLMDISTTSSVTVDKRSRDFLVIVDTSRSMRENTSLLRQQFPPTYERKTGLFSGQVDDPRTIPELARYELARESLIRFKSMLNPVEDRLGLIYFNSNVYLMSGFTSNFNFIEEQLEGMDPYVTFGTNIRWALEQGLNMIERYPSRNRQAVILLTDAEAKSTEHLQLQLDRVGKANVSFYLLWITSDISGEVTAQARDFLRTVRSIGSVYTIADMAEGNLEEAMAEIGKLEDYPVQEVRYERIDLSEYIFSLVRWMLLIWVLLLATIYHPSRIVAFSGRS